MSQFLPESFGQSSPGQVTEFSPGTQQTTQEDVALMQRVFGAAAANPLLIPPDLMAYFLDYIQTSRLIIPIGQIFGFSQFAAQIDTSGSVASISATAYTDLSGPTLDALPAGRYVLLYGLQSLAGGDTAIMSPSINGVAADDSNSLVNTGGNDTTMWASLATFVDASNTVAMFGRTSAGGSVTFGRRFLIALRYAN